MFTYNDLKNRDIVEKVNLARYEEAEGLCLKHLKEDPDDEEVLLLLTNIYINLEQCGKAIRSGQRALKLNPNSVLGHFLVGGAYGVVGEFDKAVPHMEIANKQDPNNVDILRALGFSLFERGERKAGLFVLERASEISPNDERTLTCMALCNKKQGEYKKALCDANKVLKINPSNAIACEVKAEIVGDG